MLIISSSCNPSYLAEPTTLVKPHAVLRLHASAQVPVHATSGRGTMLSRGRMHCNAISGMTASTICTPKRVTYLGASHRH